MSDSVGYLMKVVNQFRSLGTQELSTGVVLIGHVPHVAPEAYMHVLYPPLDASQISTIEHALGRQLPIELKTFYQRLNGVQLFSYTMWINGLRFSYVRSGEEAWQPYSIITPNTVERPEDADDSLVFFGGYRWDGSSLCMRSDSPAVYRCAPGTSVPLNKWRSFDEMLISEIDRLSGLFDTRGRRLDESAPTVPPEHGRDKTW